MHKESYSINIACFCNKNFMHALIELKSFFGFNLFFNNVDQKKINAVILDVENIKKSLPNPRIPKILIQESTKTNITKREYYLVIKLPLNIVQFNQDVINVCKKFEFDTNSLINIKDYVLDKNQRVLKKNNTILKITEKEIKFIEILNSSTSPLNREFILKNIWNYSSETDTHTIETHIYRLRQKIKNQFNDNHFIKNSKKGYSL